MSAMKKMLVEWDCTLHRAGVNAARGNDHITTLLSAIDPQRMSPADRSLVISTLGDNVAEALLAEFNKARAKKRRAA